MKLKSSLFYIILILLLIGIFPLIFHISQLDWSTRIEGKLELGDWLSFSGDYLGFASSTLLAIAVFRQDKKINTLVSNEYEPLLIFRVLHFERLDSRIGSPSRYVEKSEGSHRLLFEQFVFDPKSPNTLPSPDLPFRFFLSIESKSKLPAHNLIVKDITIDKNRCVYKKDIDKGHIHIDTISPDGIHYLCLQLNNFPQFNDEDVHTITFRYNVHIAKNIVYHKHFRFLITGNESIIFDGIDTIS